MDSLLVKNILDQQMEMRAEIKGLATKEDVSSLVVKIDDVLKWKWGVIGGSVVFSGFMTIVFQFVLTLFQRQ